jgi:Flp pilus assembly protein TadD
MNAVRMRKCARFGFGSKRGVRRAAGLGAALCVVLLGACTTQAGGYGLGDAALAQQDQQRQQAKQDAPDSAQVYLSMIEQMQQKGLYFASLAHLDEYERKYGATPHTTLLRADALRVTGQPGKSAEAYRSLLGTPLAAQGYRGLGLLAGAKGDFATAAQQLAHAVEASPTEAGLLSDLAYARLREGDIAGARVPMMEAAELDQKNPTIVSNLALYLLADGQVRNANGYMDAQNMPRATRDAVRRDAEAIGLAARTRAKPTEGATPQGTTVEGVTVQGVTVQGATVQGATVQGATAQGTTAQGTTAQGATAPELSQHGSIQQGSVQQGSLLQGSLPHESTQGMKQGLTQAGPLQQGARNE